jgi:hypothetical protein
MARRDPVGIRGPRSKSEPFQQRVEPEVVRGIVLKRPMPSLTAPGGAAMKQLEVGDRVKVLTGDKDDEGTVLDVDERTEMVVVYLGRHVGRWTFHRDDLRKVRVH